MPLWPFALGICLLVGIVIVVVLRSSKGMLLRTMAVPITWSDGSERRVRLAVRHDLRAEPYQRDIRVEVGNFFARQTIVLTRGETLAFAELLEDLAARVES